MRLFTKEIRRVLLSIPYLLMVVALVWFANVQGVFPARRQVEKPEMGQSYGTKASNDPALIMPEAYESLLQAYTTNLYTAYPNGFIKTIRLNDADRAEMASILSALSGGKVEENTIVQPEIEIGKETQYITTDEKGKVQITFSAEENKGSTPTNLSGLSPAISWERFQELMRQADSLIGGGSDYSETYISHRFGHIPVTYEEALADYEASATLDRYTGTHARHFSDYMGCMMGLLPVFLAVFVLLRDTRTISPLLYSRSISSTRLVLTRFAALLVATLLPLFLMGIYLTIGHVGTYGLSNVDLFAYAKYILLWLTPTAMVSLAVGMLLTTLTGTPIALVAQLLWWYADISGGSGAFTYVGAYSALLAPRHNTLGSAMAFHDNFSVLLRGRMTALAIALVLVGLTIVVFECKRRGWLAFRLWKRREVHLPA